MRTIFEYGGDRKQAGEDCKGERGARNPCPLKPATGQPIQTPFAAFNGAGGGVRRETRENLQGTRGGEKPPILPSRFPLDRFNISFGWFVKSCSKKSNKKTLRLIVNDYFLMLFFCAYFVTNQPKGNTKDAGAEREISVWRVWERCNAEGNARGNTWRNARH